MPYIAVKAFPRPEGMKEKIAEKLNEALMEVTGCPQEAVSISIEYVTPEDWDEQVKVPEMDPRDADMMILHGEKRY
jgi:phenylpyruvate tautomerase PptA (4-oxalocrotonate tautomerase family)